MTDTKATVRRFYDILNGRDLSALGEVLAEDASFRGVFDTDTTGCEAFQEYMEMMREAFPDLRITVDSMVAEGGDVAVRLTYSGTHQGQMFEMPPTGRAIAYPGAAFLEVKNDKITKGWMLGDLVAMLDQLLLTDTGAEEEGDEEYAEWQEG